MTGLYFDWLGKILMVWPQLKRVERSLDKAAGILLWVFLKITCQSNSVDRVMTFLPPFSSMTWYSLDAKLLLMLLLLSNFVLFFSRENGNNHVPKSPELIWLVPVETVYLTRCVACVRKIPVRKHFLVARFICVLRFLSLHVSCLMCGVQTFKSGPSKSSLACSVDNLAQWQSKQKAQVSSCCQWAIIITEITRKEFFFPWWCCM